MPTSLPNSSTKQNESDTMATMITEYFSANDTARAGALIRKGSLVVFPTETVYGLGADAFNPEACARIFQAKGRPQDNPLITHIYDRSQVSQLTRNLPPGAEILMDSFWPGPLTIVLPKHPTVSDIVTAGLDTVGVRMPRHAAALAFLKEAGTPVAAPSANQSGKPSPTTFAMAKNAMDGRAEAIIDGGPCDTGLESTVVAWSEGPTASGWTILRPGAVTREDLHSVLDTLFLPCDNSRDDSLLARSPGTRHPHYRPRAEVLLFTNIAELTTFTTTDPESKWTVIALEAETQSGKFPSTTSTSARLYPDWISLARHLYSDFYELDGENVTGIFVQTPTKHDDSGITEALRNRLLKASAGRWVATPKTF